MHLELLSPYISNRHWNSRETDYSYDLKGRLTQISRPNGTVRTMSYDDADQVTRIEERKSDGTMILLFSFQYDQAGRITEEFAGPLPKPYTPETFTATFDDDNRLATFNGNPVFHSPDGNMTVGPLLDDTLKTYSYNARNQLKSIAGTTYSYDAEGNRISSTVGSATTSYAIDPNTGLSKVLMRTKPGGEKTYYVYGMGLVYEVDESENTHSYHYDYRGSTRILTDDSELVTDSVEYSPYGLITHRTGSSDTPFLYNGAFGVMAESNGLYHMRARFYNPYTRRFVNPDPIGFSGGMNWYAYANGNPVISLDPFGLWTWTQTFGVIRAVGGIAEVAVGVSIGAATSWTGVGAIAGGIVALHGLDTIQAGIRQAASGNEVDSLTSQAIQSTGVSRGTANLADAGIGLASGAAGIVNGATRIPQMLNAGRAAGVTNPLRTAYYYERGSSALLTDDFLALGGRGTSAVEKGIALSNGFPTSTGFFQGLGKGFSLFPKSASAGGGLTPAGDIFFGGAAAISHIK